MDLRAITQTSKLFNTQELHIELSSKCTLKCPRCPRTELDPDSLNQEFSLEDFRRAFNLNTLGDLNSVLFCGDIGDPIYAKDLIPIVKYLKENSKANIKIVTNGSYKAATWWGELGSWLSTHDTVVFSVDGYDQESNNLYRVNSNWDSIVNGIKSLRFSSDCRIVWSSIYFNFNEDRMQDIRNIASELGCDEWQGVASSKFDGRYLINGVDPLKPTRDMNIASGAVYDKRSIVFNSPKPLSIVYRVDRHEWAKCLNWKKEMFIAVDGTVMPCPWFNSGYQDNDFVKKYHSRLNVKQRPLETILKDHMWEEFITRLETMPLPVCRIKCRDCK